MRTPSRIAMLAVVLLGLVGACGDDADQDPATPNPAAVFCEERGGTTSGPEPMCELPDGTVVDAWDYFRSQSSTGVGLANPAAVFCEEEGGTTSGPEPTCELPDGTVVDAWDHYRAAHPTG